MKRLSLHSRTGINNKEFMMYDATVAKTSLKIAISSQFPTFFGIIQWQILEYKRLLYRLLL